VNHNTQTLLQHSVYSLLVSVTTDHSQGEPSIMIWIYLEQFVLQYSCILCDRSVLEDLA
jgi:hypothetical protein